MISADTVTPMLCDPALPWDCVPGPPDARSDEQRKEEASFELASSAAFFEAVLANDQHRHNTAVRVNAA